MYESAANTLAIAATSFTYGMLQLLTAKCPAAAGMQFSTYTM